MRKRLLAALLVLISCAGKPSIECTPEMDAGDPEWHERPGLAEVWRIDGSENGKELLLPASAVLDKATRRLAILDFGLAEIIVLDLDGTWIGRWGRRGRGPGEISAAIAAAWRTGSQLSVYDPPNSKLVVFDSTGTGAKDEPVDSDFTSALGGGAYWIMLGPDGTLLARPLASGIEGSENRKHRIILKRPQQRLKTLTEVELPSVSAPGMLPVEAPGWTGPQAAMAPSGTVAFAGRTEAYVIEFVGDSARTPICRTIDPMPYRDDDIADDPDIPPPVVAAVAAAERPESPAQIGRLLFDSDGRLWVQRDRPRSLSAADGASGREGSLHDVFSSTGAYLGEVLLPPRTRLLAAADRRIVALYRDELDVYSVVAYDMVAKQ